MVEQAKLVQELITISDRYPLNRHPLLVAALCGRLNVVQYLVKEAQVDPSTKESYGGTALHNAAYIGKIEIVTWLIEKAHVTPLLLDNYSRTPLDLAKQEGHQQVVDYLQQFVKEDPNTLYEAALAGDLALVKKIVASGTSVQLTTSAHQTALHYVALAEKPNLELAEWLLQQGISPNMMDNQGNTALSLAIEQGHLDLVIVLIQAGAPLDFKHDKGWSLLHLAAFHGQVALVKYLVEEAKVSPLPPDKQGKNPLNLAIENNQTEVIAYLQAFLLKDFQANREGLQKQLTKQLETQLQRPLQQIGETLHVEPRFIDPQLLANQWLGSMQNILQGNLMTSSSNENSIIQQADELSQGILAGLKQQQHLLPLAQQEELHNISVESLRPYTETLVKELEELKQLMENSIPATRETEVKRKIQPIKDNTIIVQQQASSSITNVGQGLSTVLIEKRFVRPSKYYFINNFRAGNVNRIKQSIKKLKESLAKLNSGTLTDVQQKDIKYILNKIQKEQIELTTLYRDMKANISRKGGDSLFLIQDTTQFDETSQENFQQEAQIIQKSIDNVEKAKQLLLQLKAAQEDLYQALINNKVPLADYMQDTDDSSFENDYSGQELVAYFNNCGEALHSSFFRRALFEEICIQGQETFALIMKRLGQPEPVSTQDFVGLLKLVPQLNETILMGNTDLNKDKVMLDQQVKYIAQVVLRIIIQSTPLPVERTIQISSLQEIKKRIHKLTVAIQQKLSQPILLLEYPTTK